MCKLLKNIVHSNVMQNFDKTTLYATTIMVSVSDVRVRFSSLSPSSNTASRSRHAAVSYLINDHLDVIKSPSSMLFADDTAFVMVIKNDDDRQFLQKELGELKK